MVFNHIQIPMDPLQTPTPDWGMFLNTQKPKQPSKPNSTKNNRFLHSIQRHFWKHLKHCKGSYGPFGYKSSDFKLSRQQSLSQPQAKRVIKWLIFGLHCLNKFFQPFFWRKTSLTHVVKAHNKKPASEPRNIYCLVMHKGRSWKPHKTKREKTN